MVEKKGTERKRTEQTLREREDRTSAIVEQLPITVGLVDPTRRVTAANALWREYFPFRYRLAIQKASSGGKSLPATASQCLPMTGPVRRHCAANRFPAWTVYTLSTTDTRFGGGSVRSPTALKPAKSSERSALFRTSTRRSGLKRLYGLKRPSKRTGG